MWKWERQVPIYLGNIYQSLPCVESVLSTEDRAEGETDSRPYPDGGCHPAGRAAVKHYIRAYLHCACMLYVTNKCKAPEFMDRGCN